MTRVLVFIGFLIAAYLLLAGFLYIFQRSFIYYPNTRSLDPQDLHVEDIYQIVNIKTEDGLSLRGWYHAPSSNNMPVIIWFHGNGGHYAAQAVLMETYVEAGYGTLLAGYRGYSGNPGKPSEVGLYRDAAAWIDHLINDRNINSERIVLYGESLGSGVAVEMATRYEVGAVILQSPYSSVADIALWKFPVLPIRLLLKDPYDSISKVENISEPLLVIHGTKDKVIPIRYGKKLFARAQQDRTFYEVMEAGHNDLYQYGIDQKVLSFLGRVYLQEKSDAPQ
jgi:uncharacterized protein